MRVCMILFSYGKSAENAPEFRYTGEPKMQNIQIPAAVVAQVNQAVTAKAQAMQRLNVYELQGLEAAVQVAFNKPAAKSAHYTERQGKASAPRVAKWFAGYNGARFKANASDLYQFPVLVVVEAFGIKPTQTVTREGVEKVIGKGYSEIVTELQAIWKAGGEKKALLQRAAHAQANGAGYCLTRKGVRVLELNAVEKAIKYAIERTALKLEIEATTAPRYDIDVTVTPEILETAETAHFEASERETGFGGLYIDGQYVERVRTWHCDEEIYPTRPTPKFYYNTTLPKDAVQAWAAFYALLEGAKGYSFNTLFGFIPAILAAIQTRVQEYQAWNNQRATEAIQKGYAIQYTDNRIICDAPIGVPQVIAKLVNPNQTREARVFKFPYGYEKFLTILAKADKIIAQHT
jgi:hypothetical protein